MSIEIIRGNIFTTNAQTMVNTVNCFGAMGKGLALACKKKHPKMYAQYKDYCKRGLIAIGKLYVYKDTGADPWILNFPTKNHWKYNSSLDWIELGLDNFVKTYKQRGIESVAFPLLGCNNGGLDRETVLTLMITYLEVIDIPVEIYDYNY